MSVEEKVEKLIDPEYHFQHLADDFRNKLDEAQKAYQDCLDYGLAGYFYIGPNRTLTNLPDSVIFKRTVTSSY